MAELTKLVATFELDEEGRPKFIEQGDRKHYWINLYTEGAPEDAYSVKYQLDPSYYDHLPESTDSNERFAERLTSYGDYPIQATIRTKSRVEPISTNLSDALASGHKNEMSAMVAEALEEIKRY